MWLPKPIYERIPQFWLLLGLVFMASGVFLGLDYWLSYIYLGVGMIACAWSIRVLVRRTRNRGVDDASTDANDTAAEATTDPGTPA